MSNLDHIRSYYEALNTGDAELVASHFTDDAVHYYTRLGPHRGRARSPRTRSGASTTLDGQWWLEHGIESGRRGRDRVDDDLARPEVRREAAQPRHRVVPAARRQDLPRSAPTTTATGRTRRATCSASTTRGAATRRWTTGAPPSRVIKDTGQRAPLPPFGEEHEELRESVRRFVSKEIAPHVDEWEEAREFPRELYDRCGELGFLGLKYPRPSTAARAATTSTTRSGSRSSRARAAAAGSPPGSAPTPRSRCRRS